MANKYLSNNGLSYFWGRLKLILTNTIAVFERSPAINNHERGEFIIYERRLWKVTAPIASGDDLSENVNIRTTKLSSEMFFMQSREMKTITASSNTTIEANSIASVNIPLNPPDSSYRLVSVYSVRTGDAHGVLYGYYTPDNSTIQINIRNVWNSAITVKPSVGVVLAVPYSHQ